MGNKRLKIYIYNPSVKTGGTSNLLANLTILLASNNKFDIYYLDYLNSPLIKIIREKKSAVRINFLDANKIITIDNNALLITILLKVKSLEMHLKINKNARLLFWSTHPDDGLKILPSFNFWLRFPIKYSKIVSKIIHPYFKGRLMNFFSDGVNNNGIVFMDQSNIDTNLSFYDFVGEPSIIPIFTMNSEIDCIGPIKHRKGSLKIVVLGRLTNFKVNTLYGLIEQINDHSNSSNDTFSIDFIGDGPLRSKLENFISDMEFIKCNFLGHIDLNELDNVLIEYDLLIGMATSTLEGAKLKLPSIIIDASYEVIPKEFIKLKWLFEVAPYSVGSFISKKDNSFKGRPFPDIIQEIKDCNSMKIIGEDCYSHWNKYHSSESVSKMIASKIEKNKFYYYNIKKHTRKDFISEIIDNVKEIIK